MDAQTVPNQETPKAVECLVEKLQKDCGKSATISVVADGFSHGQLEQKFKIVLVGKAQALISLIYAKNVQILAILSKRSGPVVRTTINLKVANSSVHPNPSVN